MEILRQKRKIALVRHFLISIICANPSPLTIVSLGLFSKTKEGRSHVRHEGRTRSVSRIICEVTQGKAPSEIHHAAHSCGRGHMSCVNPKHIRWATPKENNADKILHGTLGIGENNSVSKLTEADVRFILMEKDNYTDYDLAKMFNVSSAHICGIQRRRFWKHIEI